MKRLLTLAFITLCLTGSASAQWEVYDPTVHAQLITDTAQEIAKYVEMINHQVQQIQTLTDQLNEFKHYEDLFGDPKSVLLATAAPLINDLKQTELGTSLDSIMQAADGVEALVYNASGLYNSIGQTFKTPKGVTIPRSADQYRPFAAVNDTTANYKTVSTSSANRRVELKTQIATTVEALRNATTDAEVQKLSGVLTGLAADLHSTEQETSEALATVLVQDVENRNDERKQARALKDEQAAAFSEALNNYGQTFQLLDAPTTFPK